MARRDNYVPITVRLPQENLDWVGRESARQGLSISSYLRQLSLREQHAREAANGSSAAHAVRSAS